MMSSTVLNMHTCRAVLLMTKRDLADLCLEGLLESTEQQQQDQLAALLQV